MEIDFPTLEERIATMTDQQLEELAEGESLAMADSSRLEGLILDRDRIRRELLAGYKTIRSSSHKQSHTDDPQTRK